MPPTCYRPYLSTLRPDPGRKPVIRCSRCLPGSKPEGRHVVISYFASVFGLSTIVDHHACNRLQDGQEGPLMHVVRRSDTLVRPARRSTSARAPPITLPRTTTLSMESTSDLAICSTLLGPLGGLAPSPSLQFHVIRRSPESTSSSRS